MNGIVTAICICPVAGAPMQRIDQVEAIAGAGLAGDRYATGEGSWNKGKPGKNQVTLINSIFFGDNGFNYVDSRRNIVTTGFVSGPLGREFQAIAPFLLRH